MARGKTSSHLALSERRSTARAMLSQGFTDRQIAQALGVIPGTVRNYRKAYEAELAEQARQNPAMLADVLRNTVRMLDELEELRRSAYADYHAAESLQTRAMLINTIRGIHADRAKLFGLMGIKSEFLAHVQTVKAIQERLLAWMAQNLCERDRERLEAFMRTDLSELMGLVQSVPMLELSAEAS